MRDLEFSRQVVKVRVAVQISAAARAKGEASSTSSASRPASGQPVTLRTTSPQAPFGESPARLEPIDDPGKSFDGEPVQLDGLPYGNVDQVAAMLGGDIRDHSICSEVAMPLGAQCAS